jgi:hypothetical protein
MGCSLRGGSQASAFVTQKTPVSGLTGVFSKKLR